MRFLVCLLPLLLATGLVACDDTPSVGDRDFQAPDRGLDRLGVTLACGDDLEAQGVRARNERHFDIDTQPIEEAIGRGDLSCLDCEWIGEQTGLDWNVSCYVQECEECRIEGANVYIDGLTGESDVDYWSP
jgi:hypothetical protein